MPTVEFPMWVYKRTLEFDKTGFQMVPAALRAGLIAADAASDTFDFRKTIDNTPPEPPPEPEAVTTTRTRSRK